MLVELLEGLTSFVEHIVLTFGVPGIALIALMENIFPPTPSEFLYPLAGKLAYDGKVGLISVILAGVAGSLAGAFIFYNVGYYLGDARVRLLIGRYGTLRVGRFKLNVFTLEAYDRAVEVFEKRGGIIVMIARIMPLVHGVISIPAGVLRMNFARFMIYSFIGVVLWIVPTVMLGYFLGSQWEQALALMEAYEYVWYVIIAGLVVYYGFKRWRNSVTDAIISKDGDTAL